MSLAEALGASPGGQEPRLSGERRRSGVDMAQITNIKDPDGLGRVRCKLLSKDPDVAETDWCYCMTPYGGKAYGMFFFPSVGDLVYLAYLGGEITNPVVIGSFWAGETKAPYKIDSGKNEIASVKTPRGIELRLDDKDGKQKLLLTTPSGAQLLIDDEKKTIQLQGKDADSALTLKWESGEIALKAKKKLTLAAGDTTITLESSGKLGLKASSAISADAANVELKAKSAVKAQGATAEVKATGQLTLQASGIAQLKGSVVKIN
ncbi:MAG: phage baseplate assembly protein V [Oscillospiraceae bacterium]|jgi:uncharacterized protein involved in type VI secretion and phage assembly|nr:phage baseplate assembly protein V [Oscillospiraceae bacterium]